MSSWPFGYCVACQVRSPYPRHGGRGVDVAAARDYRGFRLCDTCVDRADVRAAVDLVADPDQPPDRVRVQALLRARAVEQDLERLGRRRRAEDAEDGPPPSSKPQPVPRRQRRRKREISYEGLCEQLPDLITKTAREFKRFPTQFQMADRLGAADEVSVRRLLRDHRTSWPALKRAYRQGGEEGLRAHLEAHLEHRPGAAPDS